ncbi:MAG: 3-hydroxyacyl-ACP dehydratase FabZ [Eubacteriales bacterium]|nr:3-hydroxyacyl-ACP dehydratase FabZ [Eubacteriales bacterium]MDD4541710.1 3-hydroxyacyl-ACP dehydratase FabZ [Eubacteriales bacterium]
MQLEYTDIQKILPHRYPFLLVDRITALEPGVSAEGIKQLSGNEIFFQGHFPEEPVFPGVLQIEALAQVGGVALLSLEENKGKLPLFAGVDKVRFRGVVRPGDTLQLSTKISKRRGDFGFGTAVATVAGEVVCEATLMFALIERE